LVGGKGEGAVAVARAAVDDAVLLAGGVARGRVGLVAEGGLDADGGFAGEVLLRVSITPKAAARGGERTSLQRPGWPWPVESHRMIMSVFMESPAQKATLGLEQV